MHPTSQRELLMVKEGRFRKRRLFAFQASRQAHKANEKPGTTALAVGFDSRERQYSEPPR